MILPSNDTVSRLGLYSFELGVSTVMPRQLTCYFCVVIYKWVILCLLLINHLITVLTEEDGAHTH